MEWKTQSFFSNPGNSDSKLGYTYKGTQVSRMPYILIGRHAMGP